MIKNSHHKPVAIITGAARRIGACIAETLHSAGFCVIIHYRHSATEAQTLAKKLNTITPDTAHYLQGDLDDPNCYNHLIKNSHQRWGRLDVLVNNASTFTPTPIGKIDFSVWDKLFNSNLKAPFFLAQAAIPFLSKQKGCIVNITDIHSQYPLKNYPVYSCAKAGLAMMTQSMAMECGPDVRVNAVAPGCVLWPENENSYSDETKEAIVNSTFLKKCVAPKDIAETVLFLIRQQSITGQTVRVDGGRII